MAEKTTYYISEAAKLVQVETHVLRYWEEELKLPIRRNEMGHRYYTADDIAQLIQIKELKEQGLQLKAINMVLKNGEIIPANLTGAVVELRNDAENHKAEVPAILCNTEADESKDIVTENDKSEKMARLQYLLQRMITDAVKQANAEMGNDVKESILKELDYQFRMQEERDAEQQKREEEHYRKIDEMIRERHSIREKVKKSKKKTPIS